MQIINMSKNKLYKRYLDIQKKNISNNIKTNGKNNFTKIQEITKNTSNNCTKKSQVYKSCNYEHILKLNKTIYDLKQKILKKKLKNNLLNDKLKRLNKVFIDLNTEHTLEINQLYTRHQKDIENISKFSLEKFITELLPVIDNLHDALKTIKLIKNNINYLQTYTGIHLTLKNFLIVIKKFNVTVINKINVPFDPHYHEAISILKDNNNLDKKNRKHIVVSILRNGYLLNDRLLRPAIVEVVNKGI